jgi:hypothetical protein
MPRDPTDLHLNENLKHYKCSPMHAGNQPKPDCTGRVVDYFQQSYTTIHPKLHRVFASLIYTHKKLQDSISHRHRHEGKGGCTIILITDMEGGQ